MNNNKIIVAVCPDYRRKLQNEKYPLKLKITFKGQRRYYATGYSATKDEWLIINSSSVKGKLKTIRNEIVKIESKAEEKISRLSLFSFQSFQDEFFEQPIRYKSLRTIFEDAIVQLEREERIGTAKCFKTTINVLEEFKPNLKLSNITVKLLNEFDIWMQTKGNSSTTTGIYLRTLRTLVNKAIVERQFDPKFYPFGRNKYQIPTGSKNKRSLNKEQLKAIFDYKSDPQNYFLNRSLAFWKFTYLANGINMMDIANLRKKDLFEDTIVFSRQKTKRSNRQSPRQITIIRNEIINQTIKMWGNINATENDFVFDIISKDDSAYDVKDKVNQFVKVTNDWMKKVGKLLGIEMPITTYVARHSFSTMLLRKGASVEFISESLGHSDIKTTQNYLAGFDLEAKKEMMKSLIDF